MNLKEHKNSKKQGDAGLGVAIGWFAANGHTVCVPLTDSQDYDLIVDVDEVLVRVQVKTTTHRNANGLYCVELRTKGGNRSGKGKTKRMRLDRVDSMFVFTGDGETYLVPTREMKGASTMVLGKKAERFKVKPTGPKQPEEGP